MRRKPLKISTEGVWLPAASGKNLCIGLSFGDRK
jgi:hypothetical protein